MSAQQDATGAPEAERRIEQARRSGSETLNLSSLGLTAIPDSIAQLIRLKNLFLLNNQINTIPDSIAQFVNLQSLPLTGNHITVIPGSIAQLVNLQILRLTGNQITAIP